MFNSDCPHQNLWKRESLQGQQCDFRFKICNGKPKGFCKASILKGLMHGHNTLQRKIL